MVERKLLGGAVRWGRGDKKVCVGCGRKMAGWKYEDITAKQISRNCGNRERKCQRLGCAKSGYLNCRSKLYLLWMIVVRIDLCCKHRRYPLLYR